jgi:2-epi-5-epi-valiolone synthase
MVSKGTEGTIQHSWKVATNTRVRYFVRVAEPLLEQHHGGLLSGGPTPGRRFVVCDAGVPQPWLDSMRWYFKRHNIEADFLLIEGGEQSKTAETLFQIIAAFEHFQLDRRNEPVIIVGGGAALDAASLAASIYRRGVPFIKVPTTLLAYVDASIGIKTAINVNDIKNLVGTFAAPQVVLLDRAFFTTLPNREISSGLGEILKLGLGCDERLFQRLEELTAEVAFEDRFQSRGQDILARSISVMIRELEPNIYEDSLYRAVDLGHTFSQVYEMHSGGDGMRHGEAVALDLQLSAVIAHHRGLMSGRTLRRLAALIETFRLPTRVPELDPGLLWRSVVERTRHRGGRQRVPLPCEPGTCVFVNDVSADEVVGAHQVLINGIPR